MPHTSVRADLVHVLVGHLREQLHLPQRDRGLQSRGEVVVLIGLIFLKKFHFKKCQKSIVQKSVHGFCYVVVLIGPPKIFNSLEVEFVQKSVHGYS